MDQTDLRSIEYQCIQEEWAYCRAACPLHVDARSFCMALGQGKHDDARAVLEKTMPIAGILGRVCEAPCERACKRQEAGGAIQIGRLEQFCVRHTSRRKKPMRIPDRGRRATVLGCGISSLTVAHDLARKGYRIQVYHSAAAAEDDLTVRFTEQQVPRAAISEELAFLHSLGVECTAQKCTQELVLSLLEQGHVVYVGVDAVDPAVLPSGLDTREAATLGAPEEGLFFGGVSARKGTASAIADAAEGRSAAISMDRLTQKASLYADRDREGPLDTRLVTSLEGVEEIPPQLTGDPHSADPEMVRDEAGRCLACECMICVRNCPYLEAFGEYPKRYVRQIYNNEAIVHGTRMANNLINSCMLCGLCTTLCPHDFPMGDVCREARERMVGKDTMPPSAHWFAMQDLEFSQSEEFFLLRDDPEHENCAWLFFPGCQLCATHPQQIAPTFDWLRHNLSGGVGLALSCCGAPAHWGGRRERFAEVTRQLRDAASGLGQPTWIVACPTCQSMLQAMDQPPQLISLWEVFTRHQGQLPPLTAAEKAALVDPCTSSDQPQVQQAVRNLAQENVATISEPRRNAEEAACCGYGGLVSNANPEVAARAAEQRCQGSEGDALTYCAMCRDQIARSGKPAAHILELLFPGDSAPFRAQGTTLSLRRGNRRWLKNQLLTTYWNEPGLAAPEYAAIKLQMESEVRDLLDKRRILDSDIQQVIQDAGSAGQRFYDTESQSSLASLQLGEVTFWVHYTRQQDSSYQIHTAYSHRMIIKTVQSKRA
ncbi:pyridine nucleotide-disulfide oxidoreductase/dicluster-binding protein [Desulfohalobium retbaense]|uniref:4Fe-4S ferredoxin iron-sulfur binding domain-containing protein n=1 Tax=Desulfohalobium retbaense (strain ATCC 49708 / DSM 5692 / JCM 16813 / HR100) TaxID=485915 RepID=C8X3U6_DESRD|nr:pyridine nucleotide-disulfide oxidoreductase/dicluster-binding protein [Desulfohalobium retbaense]ACV69093.1 4Fe-4S ferredoxin iron-sulfur binding domain- containing protein [Desulfohalobium retbaense DSM 5692]